MHALRSCRKRRTQRGEREQTDVRHERYHASGAVAWKALSERAVRIAQAGEPQDSPGLFRAAAEHRREHPRSLALTRLFGLRRSHLALGSPRCDTATFMDAKLYLEVIVARALKKLIDGLEHALATAFDEAPLRL